jgi:hypothetical protein
MKKETREKKFKCEFSQEVKDNKSYTMNCYYYGCIHQIRGDCPILRQAQGGEK